MERAAPLLVALGVALAATGCNAARGRPPDVAAYTKIAHPSIFAWGAGGRAAGENRPLRVFFEREAAATAYRLYACDPALSECDALEQFGDLALEPRRHPGGRLGEFQTGIRSADRVLIVIADRGDVLLRSAPIRAAAASRPTEVKYGTLVFDRDTRQLMWPRAADAELYVLTVAESSGDVVAAVATHRRTWSYPQLVGIVAYFHDPAIVPPLDSAREYVASLFALDEERWAAELMESTIQP